MTATTNRMEDLYTAKRAAAELRRYRKAGPIPSTRALVEKIKAEGVEGATLLDIGGGIGAIQHELLDAGASDVTNVDASAPYIEAAREESERRGHGGRVTYWHGDFVEIAESVPSADIVTLDRVVNVAPDWERLVALSAAHARRLYGLVYPRDTRAVRLVVSAINLRLRLQQQRVRASVISVNAIERIIRANGLRRQSATTVGPWQVALYRKREDGEQHECALGDRRIPLKSHGGRSGC
jgi:Methyltransferase domain